ncbi:hypothetical protein [Archangium sp.]|jgi:hypothetical protein|uniref:hypothetical protein n=1 Tax=Archangium sp. TaxID=1872627 RepID=UPI002EDB8A6E
MSAGARRLTDPMLECYLVDALDAASRAQVEAVLAESEADRARLQELRAESAAFLVQHPPGPLVARFESSQRRWWHNPLALFTPVLAVAAAVALVVLVPTEDPYTTKGGVSLALHRKQGEGSVRVTPGETLSPGAALRFEVRAQEKSGYVAVVSRDAAGVVSVYSPYEGPAAVPYSAEAALLPEAIELGEVEGEEVVYALFSPKPFALDWAVSALKEGRDLAGAAPEGVSVGRTSFVVSKPR